MTLGINKKKIVLFSLAGVFFVIAGVCQYIDSHLSIFGNYFCSYLADLIFFSLLIAWAISIHIRIVQPSVRRNLILVAVLLILWLLIRMVKYRFIDEQDTVSRYLWYAYYIPQCLVPPVGLLAALGIERKNDKPISRLTYLIFVPAVLLILLIFTNDLHQAVFSFQPGFKNFSKDYRHEFGYFLAIVWIVGMTLAGGIVLFIKCSISACRKRKWIPLLTFLLCVIVCFICYKFAAAVYKVEGIELIKAWGFTYKTVAFTWIKKCKRADKIFTGMGYYTRSNAEYCLIATKGKGLKRKSRSVSSVIMTPIEEHSKKPDETRKRIEALYGDVPKIELFARRQADNWDCWGNEV